MKYHLPFTYPWQLRQLIPKGTKSIADLGCGDGYIMNWVSFGHKYELYGIEVDKKAIKKAQALNLYKKIYQQNLINSLPQKKFDVVLCSQVVEHLQKSEALKLINRMEKLALKRVIIATTNGFIEYDHGPIESRFDKHQSGWDMDDFTSRGYTVFGHGLKWFYVPGGIKDILPKSLLPILFLVSYLLTPLIRYFPKIDLFLIASKDMKS